MNLGLSFPKPYYYILNNMHSGCLKILCYGTFCNYVYNNFKFMTFKLTNFHCLH